MPAPHLRPKSIPKSEFWKEKYAKKSSLSRTKKRGPKKSRKDTPSWKNRLFLFIFSLALVASLSVLIALIWFSRGLPNPDQLIDRELSQTTTIYDRSGEHVLYEVHGDEKRTLVNLEDIPDYVKQASIAIEDRNFYRHRGFSLWAIFRTLTTNVLYRQKAGGSTLTQQLVKNAILGPEKKYSRKIRELLLARRMEKRFTKNEILQMYLNEIPYGSNAYGVEAASQKYFGKNVQEINLAEAALLAALPQAPTRYSPYGPNKDLLLGRKDYVLSLMHEQGYISASERDAAKSYLIEFEGPETNIKAPHFVMYVRGLLAEKYGEKNIEQGGYKIYTTLDWNLQKMAEEIITEKISEYGERYNAGNASLVAVDPKTGQVLTMVGSRDYFNNDIDGQVNVSVRPRQPGSSLKPLIYASLFELGYTPNTILYDVETNFSTNPAEPYRPRNYDHQERGPINIRHSLAGSLNIPAVKAIYLADINRVLDLAVNMGYQTFSDRSRFGLALVLGGGEVRLLEHTNAYSAFAREGLMHPTSVIMKVEDRNGKIIEEYEPQEKKVLTVRTAQTINSILSDQEARSYIFGHQSSLILGDRQVAVKTGTTNDFRDAWTIGYTPSLVAGVWVGNSDNEKMNQGADGSIVAAPIWNQFMRQALGDGPKEIFKESENVITGKTIIDGEEGIGTKIILIDSISGLLATEYTPEELIKEIEVFNHHSILHYVDRSDPLGPEPKNPEKDFQYNLWEKAIADWVEKNQEEDKMLAPTESDDIHLPENMPSLKILEPSSNALISSNRLAVGLQASAARGIFRVEYFINDVLWALTSKLESLIIRDIDFLPNGNHQLRVRACDDVFNCQTETIDFRLEREGPEISGETSGNISYPINNSVLDETSFPLTVAVNIDNPQIVATLSLFFSSSDEQEKNLIEKISVANQSSQSIVWHNKPEEGSYQISGEIESWLNKKVKISPIEIIVN